MGDVPPGDQELANCRVSPCVHDFARDRWSKRGNRMARMGYWLDLQRQGTFGPSERNFGVLRFLPILR